MYPLQEALYGDYFDSYRKIKKDLFILTIEVKAYVKMDSTTLANLPIELTYRMFDHLKPEDILMSLTGVSKRLNEIIDSYEPYTVCNT